MLFGKTLGSFRLPVELQGEKEREKVGRDPFGCGLVSEFDNETQLNMGFYLI